MKNPFNFLQLAAGEIHGLGAGTALQLGHYLICRNPFGVEEKLYAQLVEKQAVVGGEIVLVIHPG